jgi:hypothetical protein
MTRAKARQGVQVHSAFRLSSLLELEPSNTPTKQKGDSSINEKIIQQA